MSPQPVGQAESTSTKAKPRPSSWTLSALRTSLRVREMSLAEQSAPRATYTGASSCEMISHILTGAPALLTSRPPGEVVVVMPGSVVGAIWPPVMP